MTSSQEFHLVYKNIGETPLESILRYKKEHVEFQDKNFTYAGRLDPMAEGLLILLSDENVYKKQEYIDLDKVYEFEILWGISTDTNDVLGLIDETIGTNIPKQEDVEKYLLSNTGKFIQKYPKFSSKTVSGKPLFAITRDGEIDSIDIPTHKVEIKEADLIKRKTVLKEDLFNEIKNKIRLVNGDFRQKEILEKWQEFFNNSNMEEFVIDKICIKVTSGFYVRQFVKDLGENFNLSALANSIKRIQIGDNLLADIK